MCAAWSVYVCGTGGNPVYVDELHKFMNFHAEDFIPSWQKPSQEVTWKKNLCSLNFFSGSRNKKANCFKPTIGNLLTDYIFFFKCNPPTFVIYRQKTMMQVKATPTLCRAQIGCLWVGVFVLIFHMTLIIHRKAKGKGMMNFKCRQEDQCSRDTLVSFPGS